MIPHHSTRTVAETQRGLVLLYVHLQVQFISRLQSVKSYFKFATHVHNSRAADSSERV